jgi:hypothetical protein
MPCVVRESVHEDIKVPPPDEDEVATVIRVQMKHRKWIGNRSRLFGSFNVFHPPV